jgi:peptide/nickel transport system permease protein
LALANRGAVVTVYILRRLVSLVPILLGVSLVTFLLVQLVPGDPVQAMLGFEANQQTVDALRVRYGLDRPVWEQYFVWLGNILQGDFGRSIQTRRPVLEMVLQALGPTAQLAIAAILLSLVISIPAGIASATRKNTPLDILATFSALTGLSVPSFWLGILLILGFSVALPIFPSSGAVAFSQDPWQALRHLALPTITLGTALAAATMRMTRSSMLETLSQDFIRTARAKGLSSHKVIYKHGLRNALLPVLTLLGIQMGQLLGGVVVTETVFAWPGLGKLTVDAIFARDYPIVQAAVFIMALLFVLINLVTDIFYTFLDPRIKY